MSVPGKVAGRLRVREVRRLNSKADAVCHGDEEDLERLDAGLGAGLAGRLKGEAEEAVDTEAVKLEVDTAVGKLDAGTVAGGEEGTDTKLVVKAQSDGI